VRAHALGVDIASTFLQRTGNEVGANDPGSDLNDFVSGWITWSGTSFAAPVVTAAIALEINGGGRTAEEAFAEIEAQGTPVPCLGVGVAPEGVLGLVHS
jgi:subtilisin family serine protease